MTYRDDYEREIRKVQELMAERERLVSKLLVAQRRVVALGTLLDTHKEDAFGLEILAGALQHGRLTDAVRQLLTEAKEPLTTKAVIAELQRLGFSMEGQASPAASINSVLNRLTRQGFARPVTHRTGKPKAWVRVEPVKAAKPKR